MLAIGAALVLGAGLTRFGSELFLAYADDALGVPGAVGLLVAVWIGSPYAGLAAHDWILRRSGAVLPPPRDPRAPRALLAWAAGVCAGAVPATLLVLADAGIRVFVLIRPGPDAVLAARIGAVIVAPTLGLLVTRALCRRWEAPTA